MHQAYKEIPDSRERREAMAEEIGEIAALICGPSIKLAEDAETASIFAQLDDDD